MRPKHNDDRKRPLGQTLKPGMSGEEAEEELTAPGLSADGGAEAATGEALRETLDVHSSEVPSDATSNEGTRPVEGEQPDRPASSGEGPAWSFSTILHSEQAPAPASASASAASKSASAQVRPDLPGFQILEELGRGEFGVVFKAIEEKLDRTVAIKLPLLREASLREHYISEARNAAKLDSPGIVTVYQVGQSADEQPFVVQKYVDGHTLASTLKSNGTLGIEESARVIMRIARAIAVAHQGDIVHRDLKPANILMDKAGYPWVADFGLAVFEEDQVNIRDQLAGTPYYMSPEQMRGESHLLDGRTDIWALGIMLYECLCGKTPFQGRTMPEIREQILKRDPKPLSQRSASIPEELERVFRKCCAKSPADRYPSASQLADDLEHFLTQRGADAGVGPHAKRPRQVAVVTILLVTVLMAGILWGIANSGLLPHLGRPPQSAEGSSEETDLESKLTPNGQVDGSVAGVDSTTRPSQAASGLNANVKQGSNGTEESGRDDNTPVGQSDGSFSGPLLVAADGSGRFRTISAAIAQAAEHGEIEIMPGEYQEHLIVDKPLVLKGARRSDVKLVGPGSAAIEIIGNGQLVLEDVTISVWEAAGRGVNAIDLKAGSLDLVDCTVGTNSFSAVNALPGTDLRVDNCDLTTSVHPAIYARDLKHILVNNSRFQMEDNRIGSKQDQTLVVGIQLINSAGSVIDCTFKGSRAMGIHWRQTEQPVVIETCTFLQLDVGIRAESCATVNIGTERGNNFNNCTVAIDIDQCGGKLYKNVLIGNTSVSSELHPSAIKVIGNVGQPLEIAGCEINWYEIGLQSKDADLEIIQLDCHNATIEALSFDHSQVSIFDSEINGQTGIQASRNSEVIVDSTDIMSVGESKCNVGVFVSGGSTASIRNGSRFASCFIDGYIEWGKLELSEVTMSGEARGVLVREVGVVAADDVGPARHVRELVADKVLFSSKSLVAVEFRAAGSYHLSECFLDNPQGDPVKPSIFSGLTEQNAKNGVTRVEWD